MAAPALFAPPAPAAVAPVPPMSTWLWADEAGHLLPYGPAESAQVEAAYLAAVGGHIDPVSITVAATLHSFDFVALTQTNTKSGKSRAILRSGDAATSAAFAAAIAAHARSKTMIAGKSAASGEAVGEPPQKKSVAEDASRYTAYVNMLMEHPPAEWIRGTALSEAEVLAAFPPAMARYYINGFIKVVKKGNGTVDFHSWMSDRTHVYEEGPVVWQCLLTNGVSFFILQLLEHDAESKWFVYTRRGPWGKKGKPSLESGTYDINEAKSRFCSHFRDKTKNDWNCVSTNKDAFVKHKGKFHFIDDGEKEHDSEA